MPDLRTELTKLGEALNNGDKPKRAASKRTCEPVNVLRLAEIVGRPKTAEMIGYTLSGLQTALVQRGEVSNTAEIAAGLILEKMQVASKKKADRIVVMRVPYDKWDTINTVLGAMGAEIDHVIET